MKLNHLGRVENTFKKKFKSRGLAIGKVSLSAILRGCTLTS